MWIALEFQQNRFGRAAATNQRRSRTDQLSLIEAYAISAGLDFVLACERQGRQQRADERDRFDEFFHRACLKNGSRQREEVEKITTWGEIRLLTSAATGLKQFSYALIDINATN